MEFDGNLKDLGAVDAQPLIDRVLGLPDELWRANQYRQNAYSVHEHTESLVMVFCNGWPDMTVSKESAWDDLHDLAVPLMQNILQAHYPPGGTILRAMAAKLKPGGGHYAASRYTSILCGQPPYPCAHHDQCGCPLYDQRAAPSLHHRPRLRDQQPAQPLGHEHGQGRSNHLYLRLFAAGPEWCRTTGQRLAFALLLHP